MESLFCACFFCIQFSRYNFYDGFRMSTYFLFTGKTHKQKRYVHSSLATSYSPRAYAQVPSALKGLTSVFGMGTGVTPSLSSPDKVFISYLVL